MLVVPLGVAGLFVLPTLLRGSSLPWRLAARERRLANVALDARIPPLPEATSGPARRIVALLPVRLAASLAAAAAALAAIVLTLALALAAAEGLAATSDRYIGPWALDRLSGAVLAALALAAGVVSVASLDGLARPLRKVTRRLLVSEADLRARVEELRASRARIVDAGVEARRQLERDLHAGAQQHLVALSLELQMLRARLGDDPETRQLVEGSIEKLTAAVAELRELARDIHPAILSHRGLDAALTALIEQTELPVDYDNDFRGRVAPAAEAAAYHVVVEALANVVEHAGATRAVVRVRRDLDDLLVEVDDDGVGGADPARGHGWGLTRDLANRDGSNRGRRAWDAWPRSTRTSSATSRASRSTLRPRSTAATPAPRTVVSGARPRTWPTQPWSNALAELAPTTFARVIGAARDAGLLFVSSIVT